MTRADYNTIFTTGTPLFDVRAPVEYAKGSFPGAVNLPLMDDQQREEVGICYKQHGTEAAIALGHKLVSGQSRTELIQQWHDFARQHPDGLLYCFRGGLRSKISQQWLRESGIDYPRISGGYKAMRRFLLDSLSTTIEQKDFMIIGGRTGCGKTRLLHKISNSVDLEGLARHRGSSFGRLPGAQPTTIDFENSLAIALLKQESWVVLEDEGSNIGHCSLPVELIAKMRTAPLILLESEMAQRLELIYEDYVVANLRQFAVLDQGSEQARLSDFLTSALARIKKRLGGVRYNEIQENLSTALDTMRQIDHYVWIKKLLDYYYDPMYDYQLSRKQERVVFQGPATAAQQYLKSADIVKKQ